MKQFFPKIDHDGSETGRSKQAVKLEWLARQELTDFRRWVYQWSMTVSSYDAIASWYSDWAGDSPTLVMTAGRHLLPDDLDGIRVLDVACGHGRLSRQLAAQGASVTGVDISARLIDRALTMEQDAPLGVTYASADFADLDSWWDGSSFQGATCEMAFMDIGDLPATLDAVAAVLSPGGWFVASMVHPCFPGDEFQLSSWPPAGGYAAEGFWTSEAHATGGVRARLGSHHRTITSLVTALTKAGLPLVSLAEPAGDLPRYLLTASRAGR